MNPLIAHRHSTEPPSSLPGPHTIPPPHSPRADRAGLAAMVTATLLWGGTFVVVRDSVSEVDPVVLVFARFLFGAVLMLPVALRRRVPLTREVLVGGSFAGVFMGAGYLFQAIGLETISAGSSAFLTSAGQLFAAFLAWPVLRQRPSRVLVVGIVIAMIGCALMGSGRGWGLGAGEWWTLLGSLMFAVQIVAIARFAPHTDPVLLTMIQAFAVALMLAPLSGGAVEQLTALDWTGVSRLAYLVVAGSLAAPLLQVLAQRVLSAGRIGLLFTLEPVFALGFALTMGGERFVPMWWLGALLILSAVSMVELRSARRSAATRRSPSA